MFNETSRYANIETAELTGPDGRVIRYKRRRFLPQGEQLPLLVEVTVTQGERLDLIAANTLNDSEQFWRICDANNAMNPWDLLAELGRVLRVPLPQFNEQIGS
jgi:hypothetical protein